MTADTRPRRLQEDSEETQPSRSKRRGWLGRLIPLLLVLAGVVVLLYPVLATQYNNAKQRQFAEKYSNQVQELPHPKREEQLESARKYNSALEGVPILDPWLQKVAQDPGSEAYQLYTSQLDEFDVMARLKVPAVGIDLPVDHGTSDDVLNKGAGHLYGTSLPVGGMDTHAVLTSHTGVPSATLFDNLDDIKEGDLIFVEVMGETLAYRVDNIKVVLPEEISDLTKVEGHDYLTLFTCTPYGINSHRLLVRAERTEDTPEVEAVEKAKQPPIRIEWWMWIAFAGAGVGVTVVIIFIRRERKARKAQHAVAAARRGKDQDDQEIPAQDMGELPDRELNDSEDTQDLSDQGSDDHALDNQDSAELSPTTEETSEGESVDADRGDSEPDTAESTDEQSGTELDDIEPDEDQPTK